MSQWSGSRQAGRVFITGCARSGTTLLNRLFHAFADTVVIAPEISIDDFVRSEAAKQSLVGKRSPLTVFSVPLPFPETRRQLALIDAVGIRVVNIVRDGRDVVHQNPSGPSVNVNRWVGCMLQAMKFREQIAVEVRYEDLVRAPDSVQERLGQALGLRALARFSEYPDFVPPEVFEEKEFRAFSSYRKRPIDQGSIGHSPSEYASLCCGPDEQAQFERVLALFGYCGQPSDGAWRPERLTEEEKIFKHLSRRLGWNSFSPAAE